MGSPQDVFGPRPGTSRDRRGRGTRGVFSLPGPLSPSGPPIHRTRRQEFDVLVGEILAGLDHHFDREPVAVEVAVEEVPRLPPGWSDPVPHSIVNQVGGGYRIVLYRLPIIERATSTDMVADIAWAAILHRLGEAWSRSPEDLDPR